MHNHKHGHHNHSHTLTYPNEINKAFYLGIGLNLFFIIAELLAGFYMNSLALLSDAWHNVSDVGSLLISFFALKIMQKKPTDNLSYGYKKISILATLINAVLLAIALSYVTYDSIRRFSQPVEIQGGNIAAIAFVGIIINGISAFLFFKHKEKDMNVKSAYLHLVADALISAGVVVAGLIIMKTNLYILDPIISLIIAGIVLIGTWKLLKNSFLLNIDAVPEGLDMEKIKNHLTEIENIKDIHHIHIWALSTLENAFTGHIILDKDLKISEVKKIKDKIKHALQHFNITHITLEFETPQEDCENISC